MSNLLILLADEHDPRYMGCSGASWMQTPNLDRLAARGVRFSNAYTPSPICVPARASLATGLYVHECGYWDNAIAYDGRTTSWHHRLRGAGVNVASIGKLHFRAASDPTGFSEQLEPMHIQDGIGLVWGSVRDPMPSYRGTSPIFDEMGEGESAYNRYDRRIADLSVTWLEQRKALADGPWALFASFVAPHMPLVVPQHYLSMYPRDAINLPKLRPQDGYRRHPWTQKMVEFWDHDAALGTDDRRSLALASYFGLVSHVDEQIGYVLGALERLGLAEDTVVIYTSDHGDNLGARGMWNKSTLYRESVAIPMIVAGPEIPAGLVRRTNVNLIDIYPTALDALGVAAVPEERMRRGGSLLKLARAADDLERVGFSEYHAVGGDGGAYMLASGRYKYHHYVNYPPELFDLEADPEEICDLAGDPAYRDILGTFKEKLSAMLDPEDVDRAAKRDQNDLVARFGGRDTAWGFGNRGATPAPDRYRMV